MTTEITSQRGNTPAVFNYFDADQFSTMQRLASMFSNSDIVPKMYQATGAGSKEKAIANCMIAIETAQRIGASPIMVMQNMYIVHGKPSWSAKFLIATVNACGRFNPLKYKKELLGTVQFEGKQIENWQFTCYTTEKGSDELLESTEVSIAMAISEGWYGKNGSKWKTMPKLMLQYRTATFWTSTYAPELSMGIHTQEEILDIEDIDYEDVTDKGTSAGMNQEADKQAASTPLSMDNAEPGTAMKPNENASNPDWNAADDNAPTVQKNF